MPTTDLPPLDVAACRRQFPALELQIDGSAAIYFDGPAGSQTPLSVVDAVGSYMLSANANHGGLFATSQASDAWLASAHAGLADLVGTADAGEVAFGANMTTITLALSRALARTWRPGDEVMVTRLEHDANFTPWVLAARDAGAEVRYIDICRDDCTLNLDDFRRQLSPRTRLVAVGAASNCVGTINPVAEMAQAAHAVGARLFVDAVHYAPHRLIDVAAWGCDFVVCSTYKFFGPHVGVLWGRRELLEELSAYKLRPAPNALPGKWMTGTQNHEGITGALAAVDYLASLGDVGPAAGDESRRARLARAFARIEQHERALARQFLDGVERLSAYRVWGITDRQRLDQRAPTFALSHDRHDAKTLAARLGAAGIFSWHGNFYALPLTETLGVEPQGLLRLGMLHYNTSEEVDRVLDALARI